jgi:hypothetical protein
MGQAKVISDFSGYGVSQTIVLSKTVLVGCDKSEKTKLDVATKTELTSLTADLEVKQTDASDGARSKILIKNIAHNKLRDMLKKVAKDVNYHAEGDVAVLTLTGFPLVKEPTKLESVPKPENVKVESGPNHGEVVVNMKPFLSALVYNVYFKDASQGTDDSGWDLVQSSRHKVLIPNLAPGKTYMFKACYKCTSDRLVFSDIVRFVVQ